MNINNQISQVEVDARFIRKCQEIDYNGELINGDEAMKKLFIHDMIGYNYTIDFNAVPVKIIIEK